MATECAKRPSNAYSHRMHPGRQTPRVALSVLFCVSAACALEPPEVVQDTSAAIPTLPPNTATAPQTERVAFYEGKAIADSERWSGSESFVVQDGTGAVLCRWTWQTERQTSAATTETCESDDGRPCLFWHTVRLQQGRDETVGEQASPGCNAYREEAFLLPEGGEVTYGFVTSDDTSQPETAVEGRLLRYVAPDPPLPGEWLAFPESARWTDGALEYLIPINMEPI